MSVTDGSLLTMTTPLGSGVLEPIALHATEALTTPFLFTVETVSDQKDIDPNKILYNPCCVTLNRVNTPARQFHGIARGFHAGGMYGRGQWRYTLELVPRLWFASQTRDCRVFQKKSIQDITQTLLDENGVTDKRIAITGDKQARDFVVQYNESDLDFLTRLLEEEGYFYFFEHSDKAHTLVIADANTAFKAIPDPAMKLVPTGGNIDEITSWRSVVATAHGSTQLQDYDPLNPDAAVNGKQETLLEASGKTKRDIYHWPARTAAGDTATSRSRIRQEAAEAEAVIFEGTGQNQEFVPGGKFSLAGGAGAGSSSNSSAGGGGAAGDYVIRGVTHEAVDEVKLAGTRITTYSNSFSAFPARVTWRHTLDTPRPHMAGIFSAVVIGASGDEINTDEHGRIQVRFPWDHRKDATNDTTIWVRVVQPWSGNSWGWQFIPRVGMEVAVAFVDGDPDRPIVMGCLYNGDNKPTFPLPAEKTKSGLRTRSTTSGGTSTFSEFSIDDDKGKELVFLHAEKDLTIEVEHDETITIDNCRVKKVKKDETVEITEKQSIKVGQGRTTEITSGDDTLTVKTGNLTIEASAGKISNSALQDVKIESKTGNVTVTALQSIELKVGANSVKIDQSGITIKGLMVKLDAQMMLDMKSGLMSKLAGTMTQLNGDGMMMLKGGIMMLN